MLLFPLTYLHCPPFPPLFSATFCVVSHSPIFTHFRPSPSVALHVSLSPPFRFTVLGYLLHSSTSFHFPVLPSESIYSSSYLFKSLYCPPFRSTSFCFPPFPTFSSHSSSFLPHPSLPSTSISSFEFLLRFWLDSSFLGITDPFLGDEDSQLLFQSRASCWLLLWRQSLVRLVGPEIFFISFCVCGYVCVWVWV